MIEILPTPNHHFNEIMPLPSLYVFALTHLAAT